MEEKLQMKVSLGKANIASMDVPSVVHDVLRSPGQPLDAETRAYMEPRFGHDFSRVRVHADTMAAESARAVSAQAYTVGSDIVFGSGAYSPSTRDGRQLLAHEMTHVVQQSESAMPYASQLLQRFNDWSFGPLPEGWEPGTPFSGTVRRSPATPQASTYNFSITTDGCDQSPYVQATVERAARDAFDSVLNSDCVGSQSLKDEILSEFDGLNIDCEQDGDDCGMASRYFTQTVNIYPNSLKYSKCGPLASTILHEVVHLTEWRPLGEGDLAAACERACFGYGSGDASQCR